MLNNFLGEPESQEPKTNEVDLSANEFPFAKESIYPESLDPQLKNTYLAKLASYGTQADVCGTNSVIGGFSENYMREKFCGKFEGTRSLDLISESFLQNNDRFNGKFRACGRFEIGSQQELADAFKVIALYESDVLVEPEYYYPTKSGGYILGLGVNGENRFTDSEDGYKYQGAKQQDVNESRFVYPAGREDLGRMEELHWGSFYLQTPMNPDIQIIEDSKGLSVDQKYQLALLYMDAFGAGWTFDEIDNFDDNARILRVGVSRTTGEVVCACVADSDETSVELTEWITKNGFKNAAVMIANTIVDAAERRWPDKALYGEFRTTSAAATQAFRMGFALPDELENYPNTSLINGHVKVEGVSTDFATLCFSYDFDHDMSDLSSDELTATTTRHGQVIKKNYNRQHPTEN